MAALPDVGTDQIGTVIIGRHETNKGARLRLQDRVWPSVNCTALFEGRSDGWQQMRQPFQDPALARTWNGEVLNSALEQALWLPASMLDKLENTKAGFQLVDLLLLAFDPANIASADEDTQNWYQEQMRDRKQTVDELGNIENELVQRLRLSAGRKLTQPFQVLSVGSGTCAIHLNAAWKARAPSSTAIHADDVLKLAGHQTGIMFAMDQWCIDTSKYDEQEQWRAAMEADCQSHVVNKQVSVQSPIHSIFTLREHKDGRLAACWTSEKAQVADRMRQLTDNSGGGGATTAWWTVIHLPISQTSICLVQEIPAIRHHPTPLAQKQHQHKPLQPVDMLVLQSLVRRAIRQGRPDSARHAVRRLLRAPPQYNARLRCWLHGWQETLAALQRWILQDAMLHWKTAVLTWLELVSLHCFAAWWTQASSSVHSRFIEQVVVDLCMLKVREPIGALNESLREPTFQHLAAMNSRFSSEEEATLLAGLMMVVDRTDGQCSEKDALIRSALRIWFTRFSSAERVINVTDPINILNSCDRLEIYWRKHLEVVRVASDSSDDDDDEKEGGGQHKWLINCIDQETHGIFTQAVMAETPRVWHDLVLFASSHQQQQQQKKKKTTPPTPKKKKKKEMPKKAQEEAEEEEEEGEQEEQEEKKEPEDTVDGQAPSKSKTTKKAKGNKGKRKGNVVVEVEDGEEQDHQLTFNIVQPSTDQLLQMRLENNKKAASSLVLESPGMTWVTLAIERLCGATTKSLAKATQTLDGGEVFQRFYTLLLHLHQLLHQRRSWISRKTPIFMSPNLNSSSGDQQSGFLSDSTFKTLVNKADMFSATRLFEHLHKYRRDDGNSMVDEAQKCWSWILASKPQQNNNSNGEGKQQLLQLIDAKDDDNNKDGSAGHVRMMCKQVLQRPVKCLVTDIAAEMKSREEKRKQMDLEDDKRRRRRGPDEAEEDDDEEQDEKSLKKSRDKARKNHIYNCFQRADDGVIVIGLVSGKHGVTGCVTWDLIQQIEAQHLAEVEGRPLQPQQQQVSSGEEEEEEEDDDDDEQQQQQQQQDDQDTYLIRGGGGGKRQKIPLGEESKQKKKRKKKPKISDEPIQDIPDQVPETPYVKLLAKQAKKAAKDTTHPLCALYADTWLRQHTLAVGGKPDESVVLRKTAFRLPIDAGLPNALFPNGPHFWKNDLLCILRTFLAHRRAFLEPSILYRCAWQPELGCTLGDMGDRHLSVFHSEAGSWNIRCQETGVTLRFPNWQFPSASDASRLLGLLRPLPVRHTLGGVDPRQRRFPDSMRASMAHRILCGATERQIQGYMLPAVDDIISRSLTPSPPPPSSSPPPPGEQKTKDDLLMSNLEQLRKYKRQKSGVMMGGGGGGKSGSSLSDALSPSASFMRRSSSDVVDMDTSSRGPIIAVQAANSQQPLLKDVVLYTNSPMDTDGKQQQQQPPPPPPLSYPVSSVAFFEDCAQAIATIDSRRTKMWQFILARLAFDQLMDPAHEGMILPTGLLHGWDAQLWQVLFVLLRAGVVALDPHQPSRLQIPDTMLKTQVLALVGCLARLGVASADICQPTDYLPDMAARWAKLHTSRTPLTSALVFTAFRTLLTHLEAVMSGQKTDIIFDCQAPHEHGARMLCLALFVAGDIMYPDPQQPLFRWVLVKGVPQQVFAQILGALKSWEASFRAGPVLRTGGGGAFTFSASVIKQHQEVCRALAEQKHEILIHHQWSTKQLCDWATALCHPLPQQLSSQPVPPAASVRDYALRRLLHWSAAESGAFRRMLQAEQNQHGGMFARSASMLSPCVALGMLCKSQRPTLIVCQTSLLHSVWVPLLHRSPELAAMLQYYVYDVTAALHWRSGAMIYSPTNELCQSPSLLRACDFVITTFATLSKEFKKAGGSLLHQLAWERVIVDQVHHENFKAVPQALCRLETTNKWLINDGVTMPSKPRIEFAMQWLGIQPYCSPDWFAHYKKQLYIHVWRHEVVVETTTAAAAAATDVIVHDVALTAWEEKMHASIESARVRTLLCNTPLVAWTLPPSEVSLVPAASAAASETATVVWLQGLESKRQLCVSDSQLDRQELVARVVASSNALWNTAKFIHLQRILKVLSPAAEDTPSRSAKAVALAADVCKLWRLSKSATKMVGRILERIYEGRDKSKWIDELQLVLNDHDQRVAQTDEQWEALGQLIEAGMLDITPESLAEWNRAAKGENKVVLWHRTLDRMAPRWLQELSRTYCPYEPDADRNIALHEKRRVMHPPLAVYIYWTLARRRNAALQQFSNDWSVLTNPTSGSAAAQYQAHHQQQQQQQQDSKQQGDIKDPFAISSTLHAQQQQPPKQKSVERKRKPKANTTAALLNGAGSSSSTTSHARGSPSMTTKMGKPTKAQLKVTEDIHKRMNSHPLVWALTPRFERLFLRPLPEYEQTRHIPCPGDRTAVLTGDANVAQMLLMLLEPLRPAGQVAILPRSSSDRKLTSPPLISILLHDSVHTQPSLLTGIANIVEFDQFYADEPPVPASASQYRMRLWQSDKKTLSVEAEWICKMQFETDAAVRQRMLADLLGQESQHEQEQRIPTPMPMVDDGQEDVEDESPVVSKRKKNKKKRRIQMTTSSGSDDE